MAIENRITTISDKDQEMLYLRNKLTDLEDRSHRDNVTFSDFRNMRKAQKIRALLNDLLSTLIDHTFPPPLEFLRVHRGSALRKGLSGRTRPIIACFHRHKQVGQLQIAARTHVVFDFERHEICVVADLSHDTSDKRKAFLAL
ncbi:hypothetical protein NDU88_008956 [Pleurodeles waltl]|uniref:Uncharacterized protein n=1 Tax=Pleurodeles waltl TaxID=8319 RepID=A0AAV7PRE0_PLEWA|nr:hypothetical protein NDU88_008956 [Pleurodeles waltl]